MTTTEAAPESPTLEDGRTRCSWVAGRAEHYFFHDAEWGQIPDDDAHARERLVLTCLQRDLPLTEALDHRDALWAAFGGYDLAKVAAMDDAALDALAGGGACGGLLADRARLAWIRDVAGAGAATAKETKELREYLLTLRFLAHEAQIDDVTARFPGFARMDAARLMENFGTVEGSSHERDCWRA